MNTGMSVCPFAYLENYMAEIKYYVHVDCGRGSVLLWRHCDVMYFRFVDDVIFLHNSLLCIYVLCITPVARA